MARLRVHSTATVHTLKEEVAELHDVPETSILDWGNGYAILNVEYITEPDPEPEEAPAPYKPTPAPKVVKPKKVKAKKVKDHVASEDE